MFSIIFLTLISGWLAALLVDYMMNEVGKDVKLPVIQFFNSDIFTSHDHSCHPSWFRNPFMVPVNQYLIFFHGLVLVTTCRFGLEE